MTQLLNPKVMLKNTKPNILTVIRKRNEVTKYVSWWTPEKNKDTYYSSVLNDKQCIYSFLNTKSAYDCIEFLKSYKKINDTYPGLYPLNEPGNIKDSGEVYLETDTLYSLRNNCLLNSIGLVGIHSFDYTFYQSYLGKKNVFNLSISAVDLLEDEEIVTKKQINHLNYLLDF
jgi:hypothetical protein